ncbi:methyltransferase domain-containing protein [Streptomyces sp. ISL-99]|uniref:class I SAM-dependent methyltransferase n=1 Tax=Streptomyces sp. ISL-99 TaxID=2819193 RepID=UPI001BE52D7B|nr:class I SAM-dependent methyltransferase [Streptomyces sp. ISL-99]MBT2525391.1 methyltransferase domain-containing protein [Streptomyces sp. ISL-99]
MDRNIRTVDDVLKLLDGLFARDADRWTADAAEWWDGFYADRDKPVPFFVAKPDENLVSYAERGLITPGRALDLGCGPGRNALHLASLGWEVDAVDLSPQAIAWAEERAREAGAEGAGVRFHCADAFALTCFAAGEQSMGSEVSDPDLYRESRLHGGLAYTPESLRWIFSDGLTEIELRRMHDEPPESPAFGEAFLWAGLFRRDAEIQ